MNKLQITIKRLGFAAVGKKCGADKPLSRQAVYQWYEKGRLPKKQPRNYGLIIARMAGITKDELLNPELINIERGVL